MAEEGTELKFYHLFNAYTFYPVQADTEADVEIVKSKSAVSQKF